MKYRRDCINCENWDLYCKLGKEAYYWCRVFDFSNFELMKELKPTVIK